jgi:conjugal transfer mating pair stabilization protein TraN
MATYQMGEEKSSALNVGIVYAVIVTYFINILTFSFVVYLATRSFDVSAEISKAVSLEYSCPTGFTLSNGVCIKKEHRPTKTSCQSPGYVLSTYNGYPICKKDETRNSINQCPSDGTNWIDIQRSWNFTDPLYPNLCSSRVSGSSAATCPADHKNAYSNGVCFKLITPMGKTCPNDGGQSETITLTCPPDYQRIGLCKAGESQSTQTPDQTWKLASGNTSCQRSLYETAIETCDLGFVKADTGVCERITSSTPIIQCPVGFFQDGGQCIKGNPPNCAPGTYYKNGACLKPDGTVDSCHEGKELDPFSNLCIESKNGQNDVDYFTQVGLDMGKHAVSAVAPPQSNSNGGYDLKANVVDPTQAKVVISMSNRDTLGLDENNQHPVSASETYQDNNKQSKSIKNAIKRNQEYAKAPVKVGATEEETADLQDHSAEAYLTLMDTQNKNPPQQIGSDAAFLQQGFAEVQAVRNGDGGRFFGDCAKDVVEYDEITDGSLVKTAKHCFKPNRNNLSSCTRKRVLIPPNVAGIVGFEAGNMAYCGPKCLQITLGIEAANALDNKGNTCGIYNWEAQFKINEGWNILNSTLVKTVWDDHMLLSVNDIELRRKVDGSFPGGFPSKTSECERNTYNVNNTPEEITNKMQQALSVNNRYMKIKMDLAVGARGAGYSLIQIHFDKPITDEWDEEIIESPDGCAAALDNPDSFCKAKEWVCDGRLESDLINSSDLLDLSKTQGKAGATRLAGYGDAIVMVMRRDFDPSSSTGYNKNCGLIMPTTQGEHDGNNDDGVMVCQDGIGLATHSVVHGPAVKGTKLTNVLPDKNKWTAFAVKINPDGLGATFFSENGTKFTSSTVVSGQFDHLAMSRINVGRGTSDNDWATRANAPFYVAHWELLSNPSDSKIFEALSNINKEYKLTNLVPLFPGDDGLTPCMIAHMEEYQCDPLKGQRLPFSGGGTLGFSDILNMDDACSQYERESRCVFDKAACANGWLDDDSGICYGWDIDYTCESGTQVIVRRTKENDACFSDTKCIGDDCAYKADETNTDFVKTAAMYASINELDNERKCTDPSDPSTCQVFVGSQEFCSWDQFKVNDCCSLEGTDSAPNLFKGTLTMFKAGQFAATAEGPFTDMFMKDNFVKKGWDMVKSGWDTATQYMKGVTDPLVENASSIANSFWDMVSGPFTSSAEAVSGTVASTVTTEGGAVVTSFLDDISAAVTAAMDSVYEAVWEIMPDVMQQAVSGAASALGAETAQSEGVQSLQFVSEFVTNMLGFVMFLYSMYQLLKLVYNLLTACKEEELEMPTKLKERKCFFATHVPCEKTLGVCTTKAKDEYCCFASTLSRIIMEQAIEQVGSTPKKWYESEQCRGFTLDELTYVDFSKINFDEWIGLMVESGSLPSDLTLDKVTDEEAKINNLGRENSTNRMLNRFPNNEGVKLKEMYKGGSVGTNIDCTTFPRPALCDAGITVPTND